MHFVSMSLEAEFSRKRIKLRNKAMRLLEPKAKILLGSVTCRQAGIIEYSLLSMTAGLLPCPKLCEIASRVQGDIQRC